MKIAYEAFAPIYDQFTAGNDIEGWLSDLLPHLESCGLSGTRLLDVGCGTGKSFIPMLARGWKVTGCDISTAMLARAKAKVGSAARLYSADMRDLPHFGSFDLVWALDDAVNYLLAIEELRAALFGMKRNLGAGGLIVFDSNTLLAYRTFGSERHVVESSGERFIWNGLSASDVKSGAICEARLEIEGPCASEAESHMHRQRHFSERDVHTALASAGLECLQVLGHGWDGLPEQPLDEAVHTKAIYIARAKRQPR